MSHRHAPAPTPPTPASFLAGMVGRDVCLLRVDGAPKVVGRLTSVTGDAVLVVDVDGTDHHVPLDDCERVKFHFGKRPTRKKDR